MVVLSENILMVASEILRRQHQPAWSIEDLAALEIKRGTLTPLIHYALRAKVVKLHHKKGRRSYYFTSEELSGTTLAVGKRIRTQQRSERRRSYKRQAILSGKQYSPVAKRIRTPELNRRPQTDVHEAMAQAIQEWRRKADAYDALCKAIKSSAVGKR